MRCLRALWSGKYWAPLQKFRRQECTKSESFNWNLCRRKSNGTIHQTQTLNPAKNIPIISRPNLCRQDNYELPCISHYKLMVRKFVGIRHENVESGYLRCHPASWGLDWSSFSDGQWLIHYRTVNNIKSLLEDIHGVTSVGHSTRNLSLIGSLFKMLTSPNLFLRNPERSYLTYKFHWNALSKESKIRKQNKLGTKRQTVRKICVWTQRITWNFIFFFSKAVTQAG